MILCKTVSCLNVYLPCCSDTLKAPKMCVAVQTFLLHKEIRVNPYYQLTIPQKQFIIITSIVTVKTSQVLYY